MAVPFYVPNNESGSTTTTNRENNHNNHHNRQNRTIGGASANNSVGGAGVANNSVGGANHQDPLLGALAEALYQVLLARQNQGNFGDHQILHGSSSRFFGGSFSDRSRFFGGDRFVGIYRPPDDDQFLEMYQPPDGGRFFGGDRFVGMYLPSDGGSFSDQVRFFGGDRFVEMYQPSFGCAFIFEGFQNLVVPFTFFWNPYLVQSFDENNNEIFTDFLSESFLLESSEFEESLYDFETSSDSDDENHNDSC